CDCGRYSKECRFDGLIRKCVCQEGYSDRLGTCAKCDCGRYSKECRFDGLIRKCVCQEGYS
ncbi:hypothetical protein NPIL_524381, partial [Nephila pilipes]